MSLIEVKIQDLWQTLHYGVDPDTRKVFLIGRSKSTTGYQQSKEPEPVNDPITIHKVLKKYNMCQQA